MQDNKKHLVVVCGPTAVGKTSLAIQLANYFKTEIVSADSRQFFKEMTIGTAKPSAKELAQAKHHLVGNISIFDEYNAGRFAREALEIINDLFEKYDILILVGGSGLYINALLNGIDDMPEMNPEIRNFLNKKFEVQGLAPLLEQLKWLDQEYYYKVDQNNPQRVIRALEVCLSTGKPYSSFHQKKESKLPFEVISLALNLPREELYDNINKRVDQMMENGLLDEAKNLYPHKHFYALQTVGYSELFDYFEGKTSLEKAVELIKQHTRNYAKRQITWFKRDENTMWFSPVEFIKIKNYISEKIRR